jgi:hypothetical protein
VGREAIMQEETNEWGTQIVGRRHTLQIVRKTQSIRSGRTCNVLDGRDK